MIIHQICFTNCYLTKSCFFPKPLEPLCTAKESSNERKLDILHMSSRLCKSSLPIPILANHATNIATHWFRIKCSKIRQFEKVLPVLCGDIMNLAIVVWLGYFKSKLIQFILLTISLYFQVLKTQRFIHSLILCRISQGWGKRFCYMKEIQVYGSSFRRRGEKKTESKQIKSRSAFFFHSFRFLPDWQLWMQGEMSILCHETMVTLTDEENNRNLFHVWYGTSIKLKYFILQYDLKLHVKKKRKQRKKRKK